MAITKLRKCRNLYHELDILEERLMFGCPTEHDHRRDDAIYDYLCHRGFIKNWSTETEIIREAKRRFRTRKRLKARGFVLDNPF